MDSRSVHKKIVIAWFLSLNPLPIFQLFKIFGKKKWSQDISRDLSAQHFILYVKDDEIFYVYQILIPLNPLYRSNSQ